MGRGVTRGAAVAAVIAAVFSAAPAGAEPGPPPPSDPAPSDPAPADPAPAESGALSIEPVAAVDPGAPPADGGDGRVASNPPNSITSPDGWTLTVSAKEETQTPVAPLTTAISTREFEVAGVFNGTLTGGDGQPPKGVFEVGYQIGCGIDMSTANGVSLTGTAGVSPSIQFLGIDASDFPIDGFLPGVGANFAGGLTVGLKPGLINTVPVTKKAFESFDPWVLISRFRIKIDGCVGQAFLRSYAILTKSTKSGDAILSWYGVTKSV